MPRPAKGIRPPHLEGKRTGRPPGSRNLAAAWRDVREAFKNRRDPNPRLPTAAAVLWWRLSQDYPSIVDRFLYDSGEFYE